MSRQAATAVHTKKKVSAFGQFGASHLMVSFSKTYAPPIGASFTRRSFRGVRVGPLCTGSCKPLVDALDAGLVSRLESRRLVPAHERYRVVGRSVQQEIIYYGNQGLSCEGKGKSIKECGIGGDALGSAHAWTDPKSIRYRRRDILGYAYGMPARSTPALTPPFHAADVPDDDALRGAALCSRFEEISRIEIEDFVLTLTRPARGSVFEGAHPVYGADAASTQTHGRRVRHGICRRRRFVSAGVFELVPPASVCCMADMQGPKSSRARKRSRVHPGTPEHTFTAL
ncbi:hypothetical protein DFH09DRAFT_1083870 [Mycena vulgaris]|nr:hypothetical protein DFH09DRAFT_1083870 [Mycena vulgaris]